MNAETAGTFDPTRFLDDSTQDEGSTVYQPVPEGDYIGIVAKEPEFRPWQGKKDPSKSGMTMDLTWSVDDQGVKQLLERDEVFVRQGLMLDLTANGGIDWGKNKNVKLHQVRDAVGLNRKGETFQPRMLAGKAARIKVKHRVTEDGQIFAEVTQVAPL